AVWSVSSWWRSRRQRLQTTAPPEPVYISPWPVRLLFVQMMLIYFFNGAYKLAGHGWQSGDVMYNVLANLTWTRMAYAELPLPAFPIPLMTWTVLVWEVSFPLLVMMPWARAKILWLGIAFHLGTGILLQLGPFPLYMICLYLPVVPWEKYV